MSELKQCFLRPVMAGLGVSGLIVRDLGFLLSVALLKTCVQREMSRLYCKQVQEI